MNCFSKEHMPVIAGIDNSNEKQSNKILFIPKSGAKVVKVTC